MFLNRSVHKPHLRIGIKSPTNDPDYVGLLRFLLQPFLDSPESLSVDCEIFHTRKRAWIRIAFDNTDKGKVFGRGGRNIQAIRTVVAAAASAAGQSVYLDIYGSTGLSREEMYTEEEEQERLPPPKPREKPGNGHKVITKPRTRAYLD
ncbi:KH domain-containing protein [Iningainema tapete]|uniref:KH domain-containing protein n=1 Tax=Iningainema tapete BLCC-T55 TaxID=2748662 RepID=A0A8J7C6W2_9CYAN|nr:KH domain-containing protein [Iningainema tapete]MBD2774854.1 KH domain-containing protein [Iningainema tapete BLCC-T55]